MSETKFMSPVEHQKYLAQYNISPGRAMFTLVLSIIVDILGYSMILPLLPAIASTYGASDLMIGFVIASNALTALFFAPIWGRLSDRYGRKRILLISQIGTGFFFLMLGFSNSIEMIIFARLIDGVFGGQLPVIRAYISDITTPETRASQIGRIMISVTIGMIIGPLLSGFLGMISWRLPAFVASALSLVTIFLTLRVLVESMPPERIADLKTQLELHKEKNDGKKAKFWSGALVNRYIQLFLIYTISSIIWSSLSLVVYYRYGGGTLMNGFIMAFTSVFLGIFGSWLMRPIIKKVGEKRLLIITTGMLLAISFLYPYLYDLWMLLVFIPFYIFTLVFIAPLIQSNITKAVHMDRQGFASGWMTNTQSVAQIIAPLIATSFLQIGILIIFTTVLNAYHLIGLTISLIAAILFIMAIIDISRHKELYNYIRNVQKLEEPIEILEVE